METSPGKLSSQECMQALPGQYSLDGALVEEAVRDLNEIYTRSALRTAIQVGEYVIDKFFGGDSSAFRRSGRIHVSFRALARLGQLRFSATFLWSSVAVVEQLQCLPEDVAYRLPLSHHRILLGVGDRRKKVKLASRAATEELSKRQLEDLVHDVHVNRQSRRMNPLGRPRKPRAIKVLNSFLRSLQSTLAIKSRDLRLEERSLDTALTLVDEIQGELQVLQEVLPQIRQTILHQSEP